MSDKDYLHKQLVKLGDMMGDGLHLEPDGKWISKEYRRVANALGYNIPSSRKSNVEGINAAMSEALKTSKCKCGGELKQTRSGSYRAQCIAQGCDKKYQFKARKGKR